MVDTSVGDGPKVSPGSPFLVDAVVAIPAKPETTCSPAAKPLRIARTTARPQPDTLHFPAEQHQSEIHPGSVACLAENSRMIIAEKGVSQQIRLTKLASLSSLESQSMTSMIQTLVGLNILKVRPDRVKRMDLQ